MISLATLVIVYQPGLTPQAGVIVGRAFMAQPKYDVRLITGELKANVDGGIVKEMECGNGS